MVNFLTILTISLKIYKSQIMPNDLSESFTVNYALVVMIIIQIDIRLEKMLQIDYTWTGYTDFKET